LEYYNNCKCCKSSEIIVPKLFYDMIEDILCYKNQDERIVEAEATVNLWPWPTEPSNDKQYPVEHRPGTWTGSANETLDWQTILYILLSMYIF